MNQSLPWPGLLLAASLVAAPLPGLAPAPAAAEPVAARPASSTVDPGQLALVGRVLDLDPRQRDLVARLLALDAPERRRLELLLSLQGLAIVTADGRVLDRAPVDDFGERFDAGDGFTPVLLGVTLDDLYSLVTTVQSKITAISTTVGTVLGRLPDGSDFKAFADQIDVGDLQGILDILRDDLRPVLAMAKEVRAGFEQFDAAAFRSRLHKVLGDVGTAWEDVQRLECVELPDRTIRQLQLTHLGNLVDEAPDVALYGLSRLLDVTGEDWPDIVSDVTATIPTPLVDPGFCGGSLEAPPAAVCAVLRKEDVRLGIKRTAAAAKALGFATRLAKGWTTDDKVVCVGVDVVAGAEAGTNVKNPVNGVLETVDKVLERIEQTAEKLQTKVESCATEDLEIERQLRTCTAPRGVFLGGRTRPTFQEVTDLVDFWIEQADGALDAARVARARADVSGAMGQSGTPVGYALLCDAYDELVFAGTRDQKLLQKQLRKQKQKAA